MGEIFVSKNVVKLVLLKWEKLCNCGFLVAWAQARGGGTRDHSLGPRWAGAVVGKGIRVSSCQNFPDRSEAAGAAGAAAGAAGSPRPVRVCCACPVFSLHLATEARVTALSGRFPRRLT